MEIKIQTVNGWTDWTNAAQVVAQNWQDIGINVSIVTPEFGTWFADLQAANYDVSMGWADLSSAPRGTSTVTCSTARWSRPSRAAAPMLLARPGRAYFSPRTDELLKAFTQTVDAEEQKAIIGEMHDVHGRERAGYPAHGQRLLV